MIAVTNNEGFNENDSYVVAVPKNKVALKQHIAYNYPHWKLVDCDSIEDGANMVDDGKVDCFIMGSSQVSSFDGKKNFKIIPLTKTMEACFAVKDGQATLLSILNKTIKAMPSDMLTSAIAMYDSTAYKTTFYSFLKDHLVVVLVLGFSIIIVILLLLQKARRAEASAKVALKSAEDASLAKTQFLHNVSHDIRTPMNVILGYNQLMKKKLSDSVLVDYQKKIERSGNLLLSIINDVLNMARIESGKSVLVESSESIVDMVEEVSNVFGAMAKEKEIVFDTKMDIKHKQVLCDSTKVKEILVNLIGNAIKYTPNGGHVTVDIKEFECSKEGYGTYQIQIIDTGIGMSESFIPTLFDAFTREATGDIIGTGLGMPIVKKLVDMMGGTIDVESKLGKGSTFTITIDHKLGNEEKDKVKQEDLVVSKHSLDGKHVLLAEDNELNAEFAKIILEDCGLHVDLARDGLQCVSKVIQKPVGTYDFILMDIQMPNVNGYLAAQKIRAIPEKNTIPIIAMSANAFDEDKKQALKVGMNGYISKPIDMDKLQSQIIEILKEKAGS